MSPDTPSDNTPDSQGERLALWARILEATDELRALAGRSDWQALDELSVRREAWLQEFFRTPVPDELNDLIRRDIRYIQEADAEVVQLVEKNRALLTDEISRLQTHRKRIRDYLSHSD